MKWSYGFRFYIDSKIVDVDEDIVRFQENLCKRLCCISFTTVLKNIRLWNYYTNGLRGYVLTYRKKDIEVSLKNNNIGYFCNKVYYKNTKEDITQILLDYQSSIFKEYTIPWKLLFTKNKSWLDEKEFRYSLDTNFLIREWKLFK